MRFNEPVPPENPYGRFEASPTSRGHPLVVAMQSTDILNFDYRAQFGRLNRS
jgi:hypothetical protein